ncbi:MAG: restriction endonuclease subunit S [Terriglobia bacterium]|jgi:type I restriction enzyme S subunit
MKAKQEGSKWPTTTIAKSAYLRGRIGWQGLKASEFIEEGPFLVTGTDFTDGRISWDNCYHVSESRYAEASYIHLKNDDVVITKDGTIGKVAFVQECPEKAVLNSGIFLIRCKDDSFQHRYIFHLLKSNIFRKFLDDNLAGSTIQHLYQHIFKTFEFPIPELCEQTKIAEILSTADRAIEQTQDLIAKQHRIKTGLMQDLLTRGIDEHGNLRAENTHKFQDSPLGRIPAAWQIHPIATFAPKNRPWLRTGPFGSDLNTKHWVTDGVPVLTIGSLGEGEVIESELLFINDVTSERLKGFRVRPGDIVFSHVADIGRSLVIRPHQDGWIISSNLMRISLDADRASPEFLYTNIAFNSAIRSQLRTTSNSGGRDLVNGPILSALLFPWPDICEQERIISRLTAIDRTVQMLIRQLDKSLNIKTGLMQDLLTGKRRVTPLLEAEPEREKIHAQHRQDSAGDQARRAQSCRETPPRPT